MVHVNGERPAFLTSTIAILTEGLGVTEELSRLDALFQKTGKKTALIVPNCNWLDASMQLEETTLDLVPISDALPTRYAALMLPICFSTSVQFRQNRTVLEFIEQMLALGKPVTAVYNPTQCIPPSAPLFPFELNMTTMPVPTRLCLSNMRPGHKKPLF